MCPYQLSSLPNEETLNVCRNNISPVGGPQPGEQLCVAVGRQNSSAFAFACKRRREAADASRLVSVQLSHRVSLAWSPPPSPHPTTPSPTTTPIPPLFVCKASQLGPKGTEGRRVGGVRPADDGRPLFNLDPLSFLVLLRPPSPAPAWLNSFERDAVLLECD